MTQKQIRSKSPPGLIRFSAVTKFGEFLNLYSYKATPSLSSRLKMVDLKELFRYGEALMCRLVDRSVYHHAVTATSRYSHVGAVEKSRCL
jgi:hypothetical protein